MDYTGLSLTRGKQNYRQAKRSGEWVRYHTPDPEVAEHITECLPVFSLPIAHRDAE
jgi:hypothetical protein